MPCLIIIAERILQKYPSVRLLYNIASLIIFNFENKFGEWFA